MGEHNPLNEFEHDLLTELFNIGVGRAADSLSQMLNQEIGLSVPEISFCTLSDLLSDFDSNENIISIGQDIKGPFDMHSMLVFPSSGSVEVIKKMIDEHLSAEMATELQQEAFSEIGNIVLNACIGIIAKTMNESFSIDLPHFSKDKPQAIFSAHMSTDMDQVIMSMKVDLILTSSRISGYIAFVLSSVSIEKLKLQLNKILENV